MIRVLLVDDEQPARERLGRLLSGADDVEVVGEAADAEAARENIARLTPDLVFLDIEMPGATGIELAATLEPPRPRIIFCTAYDQYALKAFEVNALDYLLKPVKQSRLEAALDQVRSQVQERRETAHASATQQRLFTGARPALERLDYAGVCRPAREIGGDGYDFVDLGAGRLGLLVADVSGKGLYAGLLVAGLLGRVQALAPAFTDDPAGMFAELNRQMVGTTELSHYATLFYGVWEEQGRVLSYVNAGHVAPLLLRAPSPHAVVAVTSLAPTGTVVGLIDDARYESGRVELRPGDTLLCVSDGVTERTDPAGEQLGEQRLRTIVEDALPLSAAALCERLIEELERFADGGAPDDDTTILVARAR